MKKKLIMLCTTLIALVLEILPYGAVCNFALDEGKSLRQTFSDFEVDFFEEGNEGDVMFRVKDNSAFVQSILDHPAIIRQEYNTKQKRYMCLGIPKTTTCS